MIGQLLKARYQIINSLGQGGQGHTYIALDTQRPGKPKCVVKHLKPLFSHDPKLLETAKRLFEDEAQTLEKLGKNDQIPQLLAHFEQDQEFYLVEEFIEGHDLTEEITAGTLQNPGKAQDEGYVLALLQGVLPVMEFLHQQGVIHRDIKPPNIIRRRSDGKLVLIDFGAVKQVQTQTALTHGMSASISIGSEGYIPTEQLRGKPKPSSDLYALGMVGIQALTGVAPRCLQEDPDTDEVLWQHLASVSPGLAEILGRMVRHNSKERYKSATEVMEVLQQLNAGYTPTRQEGLSGYTPTRQEQNPKNLTVSGERTSTETLSREQTRLQSSDGNVAKPSQKLWLVGAAVAASVVSLATTLAANQFFRTTDSEKPKIAVNPTASPTPTTDVSPTASPTPTTDVSPTASPTPATNVSPTASPTSTKAINSTSPPTPTKAVNSTSSPAPNTSFGSSSNINSGQSSLPTSGVGSTANSNSSDVAIKRAEEEAKKRAEEEAKKRAEAQRLGKCPETFSPEPFRNRTAKAAFFNEWNEPVTVVLYHPSNRQIFGRYSVPSGENHILSSDIFGDDWGVCFENKPNATGAVNNLGQISDYNPNWEGSTLFMIQNPRIK